MTAIERTTNAILGTNRTYAQMQAGNDAQAANWIDVFNALRLIVPILIKCLPFAITAHDYFTKEFSFWERLWGAERRRNRQIEDALAATWKGGRDRLPEIQRRLKWALANGVITAQQFMNAYKEWRNDRPLKDGDTAEFQR